MHPLPARPTGRSGIETNALDQSEDAFDGRSMAGSSTADLAVNPAANPYSMPAIDHQPYYDDPAKPAGGAYNVGGAPTEGAGGAFYDPYRGPVPSTLSPHADDPYGGAADPYTRTTSPGPQAAYGAGYDAFGAGGRAPSPGPNAAYGVPRTTSPGPQAAYGGRASPGPDNAYGGYR